MSTLTSGRSTFLVQEIPESGRAVEVDAGLEASGSVDREPDPLRLMVLSPAGQDLPERLFNHGSAGAVSFGLVALDLLTEPVVHADGGPHVFKAYSRYDNMSNHRRGFPW